MSSVKPASLLTIRHLKNLGVLEAFGLVVYWNFVVVGEVNGDDAVVLKRWQAFSVVEQSLKKAGGVLPDPGLANLSSSLPFNSHLEEDTAVVRVCEPR